MRCILWDTSRFLSISIFESENIYERPPFYIRHFEFLRINVKFEISGLENPKIPNLVEIGQYSQKDAILNPPSWIFESENVLQNH